MSAIPTDLVDLEPAAAQAEVKDTLFRYSAFVDIGGDAKTCPNARDGKCKWTGHFHAWIRLPNAFQQDDIREKGLAAKARKLRELRDPESDAAVVLEERFAAFADDQAFIDELINEMVGREEIEDFLQAQADVNEREEYQFIAQDQEHYRRMAEGDLPEEQQSDEFKRLARHLAAHSEAVRTALAEIQANKRAEWQQRPAEEILAMAKAKRADDEADHAFMAAYDAWTWFTGTFKVDIHPDTKHPHVPMWREIGRADRPEMGTLFSESPEVVDGLRTAFNELRASLQRGAAGNS